MLTAGISISYAVGMMLVVIRVVVRIFLGIFVGLPAQVVGISNSLLSMRGATAPWQSARRLKLILPAKRFLRRIKAGSE